jgi:hypothetical protein
MAAVELDAAAEAFDAARERVTRLNGEFYAWNEAVDGIPEPWPQQEAAKSAALPWVSVAERALRAARTHLVDVTLRAAVACGSTSEILDDLRGEPLGIQTRHWLVYLRPFTSEEGEILSDPANLVVELVHRQAVDDLEEAS